MKKALFTIGACAFCVAGGFRFGQISEHDRLNREIGIELSALKGESAIAYLAANKTPQQLGGMLVQLRRGSTNRYSEVEITNALMVLRVIADKEIFRSVSNQ